MAPRSSGIKSLIARQVGVDLEPSDATQPLASSIADNNPACILDPSADNPCPTPGGSPTTGIPDPNTLSTGDYATITALAFLAVFLTLRALRFWLAVRMLDGTGKVLDGRAESGGVVASMNAGPPEMDSEKKKTSFWGKLCWSKRL
ncbi:hypothetical protein FB45DRAFT_1065126 [Roridomyces roridus]|uniref:Uncharacterized protein n=1 Tax=Roridomyces roridus TaxID=1738132 RepID=A0AAD7B7D7_9AGAR|nr:hypothetical protein FB45DRAFT_1065126 [Roridomyces roridus]